MTQNRKLYMLTSAMWPYKHICTQSKASSLVKSDQGMSRMHTKVPLQVAGLREALPAECAGERPLSCVNLGTDSTLLKTHPIPP